MHPLGSPFVRVAVVVRVILLERVPVFEIALHLSLLVYKAMRVLLIRGVAGRDPHTPLFVHYAPVCLAVSARIWPVSAHVFLTYYHKTTVLQP